MARRASGRPAPRHGPGVGGIRQEVRRQRVQQRHLVAQHAGLAGEQRDRIATRHLRAQRQELVADAVADERRVVVALVAHRLQTNRGTERVGLAAAQSENRMPWPRLHAPQPVGPRTAQQVHEDRLRLVVHGVTGGDVGRQDGEAGRTGPGLEVGAGGDGHPMALEPRAEPCRRRQHHFGLGLGPRAQSVIDVHRGHGTAGRGGQDEEGQRIRSPGDGAVPAVRPLEGRCTGSEARR